MPHELDQILIVEGQTGFAYKLGELRGLIMNMAKFGPEEDEIEQVRKIIVEVFQNGDKAVSEFTKDYDGVDLRPDEFRISEEDLAKAHKETEEGSRELCWKEPGRAGGTPLYELLEVHSKSF